MPLVQQQKSYTQSGVLTGFLLFGYHNTNQCLTFLLDWCHSDTPVADKVLFVIGTLKEYTFVGSYLERLSKTLALIFISLCYNFLLVKQSKSE
jgi:hypothetical protein